MDGADIDAFHDLHRESALRESGSERRARKPNGRENPRERRNEYPQPRGRNLRERRGNNPVDHSPPPAAGNHQPLNLQGQVYRPHNPPAALGVPVQLPREVPAPPVPIAIVHPPVPPPVAHPQLPMAPQNQFQAIVANAPKFVPFIFLLVSMAVVVNDYSANRTYLVQLVGAPEYLNEFDKNYREKLQASHKIQFFRTPNRSHPQNFLKKINNTGTQYIVSVWLLVKEDDFDDRAGRLDRASNFLFEQVRHTGMLYDHISIVVLNKTGKGLTSQYLRNRYMKHLITTEAEDLTQRTPLLRRIISNILVNERYLELPGQKDIQRLLNGAEITSKTYSWLQLNYRNETFNPSSELLEELSGKLSTAIRMDGPSAEDDLLDRLYQAINYQKVSSLMECLLQYLPTEREKIKLLLKQRSNLSKVMEELRRVAIDGTITTYLKLKMTNARAVSDTKHQDKLIGLTQQWLKRYSNICTPEKAFAQKQCNREELIRTVLEVPQSRWQSVLTELLRIPQESEL